MMTVDTIPCHFQVDSLNAGMNEVVNLVRTHNIRVAISRVANNFYKRPTGKIILALGVDGRADRICKSLAPGHWTIDVSHLKDNIYQFHTWYSRFLPYAKAMMLAEEGYKLNGIDFESINCLFKTVMGFVDLGTGLYNTDKLTLINQDDANLFSKCYNASMNVSSPSLVFDEVFRPCAVYVALHRPDIVAKTFGPDSWIVSHIKQAIEAMNKPVPDFTKPRRRS